jgi:hypothetical protein
VIGAGFRAQVLLAGLLACTGSPAPVPVSPVAVDGTAQDIRRFAGTWQGEFQNPRASRSGTIVFLLPVERDTGRGSVTFAGVPAPLPCADFTHPQQPPAAPVVLRIGRLAVADGSVAGWLEPYRDSERGCWVDTWFQGRLRGDTLRGTFFSHPTSTDTVLGGSWWAARIQ